jgi:hypothetical protein
MELLVLRLLGRGVEDPCGDSGVSGFVRVMVWTGSTGARDAADFLRVHGVEGSERAAFTWLTKQVSGRLESSCRSAISETRWLDSWL